MSENPEDRRLDDELASFTDRLLNPEAGEKPQPSTEDAALGKLQSTVAHLVQASGDVKEPEAEFAARLRTVLSTEWQKTGDSRKVTPAKEPDFWENVFTQVRNFFKLSGSPGMVLRFGAVAIGALLLLLFVLPGDGKGLVGAAGSGELGWPAAVILGILSAGVIWFLLRRKSGK